jgi:hypothetical protein
LRTYATGSMRPKSPKSEAASPESSWAQRLGPGALVILLVREEMCRALDRTRRGTDGGGVPRHIWWTKAAVTMTLPTRGKEHPDTV